MQEVKLVIALLAMEVINVSNNTLSKAAMAKGMNNYIYTTYTHAISFLFLIPMALFFHRKTLPPSIGYSIVLRLLLLGLINGACFIFFFKGISYSSPTLASALSNLSPAFTFITAIIFRMEKFNPKAQSGILKLVGTIVSITGAFILSLYQGLPITIYASQNKPSLQSISDIQLDWAFGAMLVAISCIFLSFSYITKTWIVRDYNSEVMIALLSCFFETIAAAIVTFVLEKDASIWTPTMRIELLSILIGAFDVTIVNVVITWASRVKGPVYVAMFAPLQMIIAIVMGVFFLGEILHVGSVIGGTIISLGFYTVMKGKAEEEKFLSIEQDRWTDSIEEEASLPKVPLLANKSRDVKTQDV